MTDNKETVTIEKTKWSDLWKKEDWLAIWIGFIIIALGTVAVLTQAFDFSALKFSTWTVGETPLTEKMKPLAEQLSDFVFWRKTLVTFVVFGLLFTLGAKLQGTSVKKYIPAFCLLFVLGFLVRLISAEFTLNR